MQRVVVLAALLAAACCLAPRSTHALVGAPLKTLIPQTTTTTRLYSDTQEQKNAETFVNTQKEVNGKTEGTQEKQQEQLSELDARVLKSMLQEDKLDLEKEENLKKLLERGIAPKSAPTVETPNKQEQDGNSDFSSTLFKVPFCFVSLLLPWTESYILTVSLYIPSL